MPGSLVLFALLAVDPAAPPRPATIEISGRVLDADAKPAAKVAVALTVVASATESRQLQLSGKTAPEPITGTLTDDEGRYRLAAPGIGMYTVTVRAPGAVPLETALLPLLAPVELPPARLEKSEPLRVRISASDGTPRAGVRVVARQTSATRSRADGWSVSKRLAVTDTAGLVQLPRTRGESLELAAAGGELAEMRETRVASASMEMRARGACPRPLLVHDRDGQPVAGAFVSSDALVLGVTDAAGQFTVALPCRIDAQLFVDAQDGRAARVRVPPVEADRPIAALTVTLEPPDRFTGRVLDAETRAPLVQAFVWNERDPAGFVRTDAKGTYVLMQPVHAEPNARDLRAAATGHLPRSEKAPQRRGSTATGPTFALQPTATLAGTVVDATGRPVASVEIRIEEWSPETLFRFRARPDGLASRTISRENGGFRVEVLPRRAYTLTAARAGFATATITVADQLAPGTVRSGLQLVLTSGAGAFGKIVNARSEPVAAATVRLLSAAARTALPKYLRPPDASEPEKHEVFSDAEGAFRFEHLPPGRFDLEVRANGFAPRAIRGVTVESTRAPSDLGTVVLEPGATLSGTVEDARGQSLSGVTVAVVPPSLAGIRGDAGARQAEGDEQEVLTESGGDFTFEGLAPESTVDVTARKRGFVPATMTRIEIPPSQPLRIVLEPAARIVGRVRNEQGEPVVAAVVSARPVDAALPATLSGRVTETDAAGVFALEDLAAGKMTLSAAAKDYLAPEPLVLEVAEGRSLEDVELTLRRGSTLEGVVLTPGGQPASAARVTLRRNWTPDRMLEIETAGSAQTDGDGRYFMEGVPTGTQTVTASQDGYQGAVRDLEVRPGANRLDLRLAEGYGVSGRVTDGQGRALAAAAVTILTSGPGSGKEELSGSDGAFRFQGLGSGRYSLSANKEGYSAARQEVQLEDRGIEGLELRLQQGGGVISGRILGLPAQSLPQLQITSVKRPMDNLDAMREGQMDHQGNYRVEGVYPGEWTVTARLPSGRQAQKSVSVAEGNAQTQADLEFARGVTLSGRVRRRGQPVASATVQARGVATDSTGSSVTDSAGAFRIEGLVAGDHELVVTVAQSGLRHERMVSLSTDQNLDLDLPTAQASGQVVDAATSAPLPGVMVTAEPAGNDPGTFSPRATTDASGTFELGNLARGSYRLTAAKDGYIHGNLPLELAADDARADGLRITLEPEQGLILHIASTTGTPPARIGVALFGSLGQLVFLQAVSTGENGRTRVANAPGGTFHALVGGDATATLSLAVTIPGQPVPLVLPRAGRVRVEVAELAGAGATGTVMLFNNGGEPFRFVGRGILQQEWPLVNGIAIIDGLPSGTYTVRAAGPAGKSWQSTVVTTEGQETQARL